MHVYFLRHGKAQASSSTNRDEDRELTPEGREIIETLGQALRVMQVHFDVILTSPYARAVESARAVYTGMEGAPRPEPARQLGCGATIDDVLELLAGLGDAEHVLLVGHMPDFSEIVTELLNAQHPVAFKTGTLCGLALDNPVRRGVRASLQIFLHPENYLSLAAKKP